MKLVRQIRDNKINIIELATKLGRIDRMNSEQTGMFDIPPVTDATLNRLHAMAFGIPRIDDDAHKCTPTVGELFTNQWGDAPDWVLLPEGDGGARRSLEDYHAMASELRVLPAVAQEGQRRTHRREHQTTHSGGVFDLRVGDWSVW